MDLAQGHKAVTRVMFEPATSSVSRQALQHYTVLLKFHQNKIRTPEIGLSIYDNQHPGTIQTMSSQPVYMAGKAGVPREKHYKLLFIFILSYYPIFCYWIIA